MSEATPTNGVTLSGWGATLRVYGREVLIVVALLMISGSMVLDRRDRATADLSRMGEHQAILDSQNDLACMLAIPTDPKDARLDAAMDPKGACHYIATVYRWERPRSLGR